MKSGVKGKFNKRLLISVNVILVLIFLFSSLMVAKTMIQGKKEEDVFEKLAASVEKESAIKESPVKENLQSEDGGEVTSETKESDAHTKYYTLYDKNPDFSGWLTVNNTKIDYPVMFTPGDPQYYLHRSFDGTESLSGTPFIGANCNIDSDCFIIYSHNMKNGTMFKTLDNYAKKEFFEQNPTFTFTTLNKERTYEVFAAISTRVLYDDENGFRYYDSVGDLSEEDFDALISWLKEKAIYDSGITPSYGEQILLLSTCSYHTDNGRFVVAARLID